MIKSIGTKISRSLHCLDTFDRTLNIAMMYILCRNASIMCYFLEELQFIDIKIFLRKKGYR